MQSNADHFIAEALVQLPMRDSMTIRAPMHIDI